VIRFRAEETIERPAAEIWAVAADVSRHHEWMAVTDSELVGGDDGSKIGARTRQTMRVGPLRFQYEFEVTRSEPGRAITWLVVGRSSFQAEASLDMTPVSADATRVVYSGTMAFGGPWRLLQPLMAAEAQAGEARELKKLKMLVESSANVVAAAPA
jgi:uncharacterized membrane protein